MQLRWNYAAFFGHPEQRSLLLREHLTALRVPQQWKVIQDHFVVIAMKWWISKGQEKRRTQVDVCQKSCAQGWELSFSILSREPLCLVLKVISCSRCWVFLSFLGLRPTSSVPGHSSVLQHSLIFRMQWRAKPISPQRATRAQLSISSSGTCEHT